MQDGGMKGARRGNESPLNPLKLFTSKEYNSYKHLADIQLIQFQIIEELQYSSNR